jgi:carbon-monoxide dehydrogenase large subunit
MLHPKIVEGQIIGGIAHGLGNALFEWMAYDENAQPVSNTLAEYLLITATEMPPPVEFVHLESPSPLNELGIKGVGESGVIPMTAAVASAIEDALAPFNVNITKVPLSPPDIIALIDAASRKGA